MKCPKCNSVYGYQEEVILKTTEYFDFDGVCQGHSELYYVRGGKRKYCASCLKDITKYVEQNKKEG